MQTQKNQIGQFLYTDKHLTAKLRDEANKNPAFSAVCHTFALRERSRKQVTLRTLNINMQREGFKYDKGQYARSLRFLANLGVGEIDMDRNNRLRSLKNINVALPTIAIAALSKGTEDIPTPALPKPKPKPPEKARQVMATITIEVDNKIATAVLPIEKAAKYIVEIMSENVYGK